MPVDPTGQDLKRLLAEDPGGPVVMLNLLKFKDGGRDGYEQYAERIRPFLHTGTYTPTGTVSPPQPDAPAGRGKKVPPANPVDVNRASAAELRTLPGIGPTLATRIVFEGRRAAGVAYVPQDPGYIDLTGTYPFDPAKAKQLLAEAGIQPGFSMTISLPPPPYARRGGEVIAALLQQVGVNAKLVPIEWAQWLDQVFKRHDFDLTIATAEPLQRGNVAARKIEIQRDCLHAVGHGRGRVI